MKDPMYSTFMVVSFHLSLIGKLSRAYMFPVREGQTCKKTRPETGKKTKLKLPSSLLNGTLSEMLTKSLRRVR
ncbi:hypothetical protein M7I_5811 [Glarea lozoyensis 74030]|uniref:Uncharacterized protein n=1 Tax=Glarea lozoyensis (strain ATCC 74030 / MF5533) TaxID=1104152 RepID=H0ESZ4_GLAL7|nr:hypothetical protein M7I_5811 [Glarea lozoyensis 74030]